MIKSEPAPEVSICWWCVTAVANIFWGALLVWLLLIWLPMIRPLLGGVFGMMAFSGTYVAILKGLSLVKPSWFKESKEAMSMDWGQTRHIYMLFFAGFGGLAVALLA